MTSPSTTGTINTPSRIKVWVVQIVWPHRLVMMGRMVLGEVVGIIVGSFFPMHKELPLFDAVSCPIIPHINRLRSFLLYGIIDDSFGAGIIGLDWSWRLGVAKVFQSCAEDTGFLRIMEESADFGFCGGG